MRGRALRLLTLMMAGALAMLGGAVGFVAGHAAAPAPLLGDWKFASGSPVETTGNWSAFTPHGSTISNGQLVVTGTGNGGNAATAWASASGYSGPVIKDKTLVSWVKLDSTSVTSGSPVSLYNPAGDVFDAVDYAEQSANQWMAGSDFFRRTAGFSPGLADTDTTSVRQVAISYHDNGNGTETITGCLNGTQLGSYSTPNIQNFDSQSRVLFGPRHMAGGTTPVGSINAHISESRVYGGAMSCSQVAAVDTAVPGATLTAGAITWSSRYMPLSAIPTSMTAMQAAFNAAPSSTSGYCTQTVATLAGRSNGNTCGATQNIGEHITMPITVSADSTWHLQFGPDWGNGGGVTVDGVTVSYHAYDLWWGGSTFGNPSTYFDVTVPLSAGAHTIELWGGEVCCDGQWGARLAPAGSTNYTSVKTAAPTATISGINEGAKVEFGTPAPTCSVTDPVAGTFTQPVSLTPSAALGAHTATCAYTDTLGLSTSTSVHYTVVDTTAPALPTMSDANAVATAPTGAPVTYTVASAVDAVDGNVPVSCLPASGSTFPVGDTAVVCKATDASGNSATGGFTVHVTHPAPTIDGPGSAQASAVGASTPVTFAPAVTASDVVDGTLPVTCTDGAGNSVAPTGGSFELGDTTVTCAATNSAASSVSHVVHVSVVDNSTPVVNAPASVTAEATGADGAHVTYGAATASDAVDSTLPASCSPVSGSVFPLGDTLVTCSATDPHNSNIGTASLTVTVQDTTAPTLNVPASLSVEATGPSGADISFAPGTANDVVDGVITPICDAGPGTFAVGQTTVSCTATDTHSNTVTKTFTVSVTDTTPPVVTVPADMVVEATGPTGTPATFNASGADLVDGNVTAVCTPDSGKVFGLGETLVNCTADDSHGNVGKASFSVTVVDTTAPSLALSANLNADATSKSGTAVTFTATATDIVDGDVTPTCSPASGSTFAIGSTTVNCSATDAHTNAAAGHFTVVVSDTTPPVVSVPAAITAEATGPTGATVGWSPPTATDMVDGTDPVSCDRTSGSTFALGSTLVTCTSTNSNGLSAHNTFTVAVVDTTAPTLSLPANIMATATKAAGADVSYGKVSANDLVDGALTPSCSKASGSTFAAGVTTVTCAVTDSHHNTATASFTVTVTFAWSGLLNPVTDGGTYKLGSTIPVKFALTGASAGISTLAAQLYVTKVSGTPAGTSQPAISTSAASTGNMFRNDGTGYIFNLSTKPLSTGTWQLRVDLGDGVPHVVTISLR